MRELKKYREEKRKKTTQIMDDHAVYQEEANKAIEDFEKIENG